MSSPERLYEELRRRQQPPCVRWRCGDLHVCAAGSACLQFYRWVNGGQAVRRMRESPTEEIYREIFPDDAQLIKLEDS